MNDKKDKASRGWPFLLAALWLACAVWLVAQKWAAIKGLGLPDTDDNLRLQQVRDWLAGQAWFDLRQHRMSPPERSEEHTSELQSLMRISYAVFCLKKKKNNIRGNRIAKQ